LLDYYVVPTNLLTNNKHENEQREPIIKAKQLITITQLTHMEGGSEPVDETASLEKEA
jgi:hypothetical protein